MKRKYKNSKIYDDLLNSIDTHLMVSIDKKFFVDLCDYILENLRKNDIYKYNKLGGKLRVNLSDFDRQGLHYFLTKICYIEDSHLFLKELYLKTMGTIHINKYKKHFGFSDIYRFNDKELKKNKLFV